MTMICDALAAVCLRMITFGVGKACAQAPNANRVHGLTPMALVLLGAVVMAIVAPRSRYAAGSGPGDSQLSAS